MHSRGGLIMRWRRFWDPERYCSDEIEQMFNIKACVEGARKDVTDALGNAEVNALDRTQLDEYSYFLSTFTLTNNSNLTYVSPTTDYLLTLPSTPINQIGAVFQRQVPAAPPAAEIAEDKKAWFPKYKDPQILASENPDFHRPTYRQPASTKAPTSNAEVHLSANTNDNIAAFRMLECNVYTPPQFILENNRPIDSPGPTDGNIQLWDIKDTDDGSMGPAKAIVLAFTKFYSQMKGAYLNGAMDRGWPNEPNVQILYFIARAAESLTQEAVGRPKRLRVMFLLKFIDQLLATIDTERPALHLRNKESDDVDGERDIHQVLLRMKEQFVKMELNIKVYKDCLSAHEMLSTQNKKMNGLRELAHDVFANILSPRLAKPNGLMTFAELSSNYTYASAGSTPFKDFADKNGVYGQYYLSTLYPAFNLDESKDLLAEFRDKAIAAGFKIGHPSHYPFVSDLIQKHLKTTKEGIEAAVRMFKEAESSDHGISKDIYEHERKCLAKNTQKCSIISTFVSANTSVRLLLWLQYILKPAMKVSKSIGDTFTYMFHGQIIQQLVINGVTEVNSALRGLKDLQEAIVDIHQAKIYNGKGDINWKINYNALKTDLGKLEQKLRDISTQFQLIHAEMSTWQANAPQEIQDTMNETYNLMYSTIAVTAPLAQMLPGSGGLPIAHPQDPMRMIGATRDANGRIENNPIVDLLALLAVTTNLDSAALNPHVQRGMRNALPPSLPSSNTSALMLMDGPSYSHNNTNSNNNSSSNNNNSSNNNSNNNSNNDNSLVNGLFS